MNTITLHPINHGFDNDNGCGMETWNLKWPAHLKSLLVIEYKWLRKEGVSRRVARWHVHRMLSMMAPGAIPWVAELVQERQIVLAPEDWDEDWWDDEDDDLVLVPIGED